VTRAELRLLKQHASTIGRLFRAGGRIVELGCGNGEKLAALLKHANARGIHAHLIDLSESALAHSVQTLFSLSESGTRVTTHHATYEDGLATLPAETSGPTLIAAFGSNIGNFDGSEARAFLTRIRATLRPCDYLLLGVDLVKPERDLLLAYDDPLGVTAAFNKNVLLRMNAELGADFVVDRFAHRALWNQHACRVEMHLVSLLDQEVDVAGAGLRFRLDAGETIWTESSYKFTSEGVRCLVEPSGFAQRHQWIDDAARFALTLFQAV
jgi:dimethylhistidine N-methyltransferase